MIFSKDVLFIHVPKTGGMSTSGYLLDILPRPVYLTHPAEVWNDDLPWRGIVQIVGRRHESLMEARDVVARHGFDIHRFPIILATIRNPYDLEVSRYTYLRIGYHWERGAEQDLALSNTFEEYAVMNEERGGSWATSELTIHLPAAYAADDAAPPRYPNELKDFYTLDGGIPDNLCMIRFENLVGDLLDALRSVGIDGCANDFPWVNQSRRDSFLAYYTRRAEQAVYRRYRWVFDRGLYPRLDPRLLSLPAGLEQAHTGIDGVDGIGSPATTLREDATFRGAS